MNLYVLLCLTLLTGCSAIYGESFECPPGEGVACKSISEVNAMINRGEIGQNTSDNSASSLSEAAPASDPHSSLPLWPSNASFAKPVNPTIVRRPEQVMRVWIAPHVEDSGAYVGETFVYTVVKPGAWVEQTPDKPLRSPAQKEAS